MSKLGSREIISDVDLLRLAQRQLGEPETVPGSSDARRLSAQLRVVIEKLHAEVLTGNRSGHVASADRDALINKVTVKFKEQLAKEEAKRVDKQERVTEETEAIAPGQKATGSSRSSGGALRAIAVHAERQVRILSSVDSTLDKVETVLTALGTMMVEAMSSNMSPEALRIMRETLALDRRRFEYERRDKKEETISPTPSQYEDRPTSRYSDKPTIGQRMKDAIKGAGGGLSTMYQRGMGAASGFYSAGSAMSFLGGAALAAAIGVPLMAAVVGLAVAGITVFSKETMKRIDAGEDMGTAIKEGLKAVIYGTGRVVKVAFPIIWDGIVAGMGILRDLVADMVSDLFHHADGFGDEKALKAIREQWTRSNKQTQERLAEEERLATEIAALDEQITAARRAKNTELVASLSRQREDLIAAKEKARTEADTADAERRSALYAWIGEFTGLTGMWKNLGAWVKEREADAEAHRAEMWEKQVRIFNDAVDGVKRFGETLATPFVWMGERLGEMKDGFVEWGANFHKSISEKWNTAVSAVKDTWSVLSDTINGAMESLASRVTSITDWFKSWKESIGKFFENLKRRLPGAKPVEDETPKARSSITPTKEHHDALQSMAKQDAANRTIQMEKPTLSPGAEKFAVVTKRHDDATAAATVQGSGKAPTVIVQGGSTSVQNNHTSVQPPTPYPAMGGTSPGFASTHAR